MNIAENKACAVILAAGQGKRMKSAKPKVLCEVLFKPMLTWVTDSVQRTGIGDICVVVGHQKEQVINYLNGKFTIAEQAEQLGTGHAVMQCRDFLKEHAGGHVVVLVGDAPFIDSEIIEASFQAHLEQNNAVTVLTACLDNPSGYGHILRDQNGDVCAIVEHKDATDQQKEIKEINSGAFWFRVDDLLIALGQLQNNNVQGEFYLTGTLSILLSMGKKAGTFVSPDNRVVLGANDRAALLHLNELATDDILARHLENGVEILSRDGILISPDAVIGADTRILPGTIIKGRSVIGTGCTIGPNSMITDSIIGDNTVINATQVTDSVVGKGTTIGPFSQLRPGSKIGDGVKIGDFVEIKNSNIGNKTSVAHLTYIGDSDVGQRVNFGCGCVTVNYDGKNKYRTVIGDYAFIGCNTNLVAPVRIGNNAYTAAGSTITRDVPDDSLAISRAREQSIRYGWVEQKIGRRRIED